MAITFPTSLDALTNPAASSTLTDVPHATQHADVNDAIEAIETKLGIDSSAVNTSIDYLLKNVLSIDPGHKHTASSISGVEVTSNKVTSISGASTDAQYPSAKLLFDQLALKAPLISPVFTTPDIGVATGTSIDLVGAAPQIRLSNVATNDVNKSFTITLRSRLVANADVCVMQGVNLSTLCSLSIGGSNASYNCATSISFYTATDNTTLTGTERLFINNAGLVEVKGTLQTPTLLASANDSGALGASGTAFSDLFLANGGVINWNAGEVTLTHLTNALQIAGADVTIGVGATARKLDFRDTDVAHGVTTLGNTNAWGQINEMDATKGGMTITGFSDGTDNQALSLRGVMVNDPDVGVPAVQLTSYAANGTGVTALGATKLAFRLRNNTTSLLDILGNGNTTFAGSIALGANSITMTGSLAATGARVTKGWFTDIESTNMPTVGGTAILTSLTAPQFTTIELGHATANTLSASGGVLSIEGVAIPTISSTSTLTNKRITKRVASTTDDATAVIDSDSYDEYYLTAIANATEISVTGTPTTGQTIFIGLKDAGVAKALTWTGITGLGVTLPTTTVAGKQHIIEIKYIASAWRGIAVSVEA